MVFKATCAHCGKDLTSVKQRKFCSKKCQKENYKKHNHGYVT